MFTSLFVCFHVCVAHTLYGEGPNVPANAQDVKDKVGVVFMAVDKLFSKLDAMKVSQHSLCRS
jgi:gamma-glutamylcyclotransferase (GGCT)/AIG2-like uncharacterized protein YtfP